MFIAHHAGMVREKSHPFVFQNGEISFGLLGTENDGGNLGGNDITARQEDEYEVHIFHSNKNTLNFFYFEFRNRF